MYGLNMFALLAFCAFLVLSARIGTRMSRLLCGALLTVNLIRYALPPILSRELAIPVEFSTVSYFVVPLILLLGLRRVRVWGAYAGIMAGFFYYITMAAAGGPIYNAYPHWDIYLSMCCHGTLFALGLSTLRRHMFQPCETWKLALGVTAIALNAILVRPIAEDGARLFIYELLDAVYIQALVPRALLPVAIPLYFISLFGALYLTMRIFFRLNRALYRQTKSPHAIPVTEKGIASA